MFCTESQFINTPHENVHPNPYPTPGPVLVSDDGTFHLPHDLSVQGEVAGVQVKFLIDTGAAISVVSAEFLQSSSLAFQLQLDMGQLHAVNTVSGEQLPVTSPVNRTKHL